jgi:hypothetical protein
MRHAPRRQNYQAYDSYCPQPRRQPESLRNHCAGGLSSRAHAYFELGGLRRTYVYAQWQRGTRACRRARTSERRRPTEPAAADREGVVRSLSCADCGRCRTSRSHTKPEADAGPGQSDRLWAVRRIVGDDDCGISHARSRGCEG